MHYLRPDCPKSKLTEGHIKHTVHITITMSSFCGQDAIPPHSLFYLNLYLKECLKFHFLLEKNSYISSKQKP